MKRYSESLTPTSNMISASHLRCPCGPGYIIGELSILANLVGDHDSCVPKVHGPLEVHLECLCHIHHLRSWPSSKGPKNFRLGLRTRKAMCDLALQMPTSCCAGAWSISARPKQSLPRPRPKQLGSCRSSLCRSSRSSLQSFHGQGGRRACRR